MQGRDLIFDMTSQTQSLNHVGASPAVRVPGAEEKTMAKLFFCARTGWNESGAWASLWTKKRLMEFLSKNSICDKASEAIRGRRFKSLRVEIAYGSDDRNGRIYSWGESEPGFDSGDLTDHVGMRILLDGETVYNDLRPYGDEDEVKSHDLGCKDCGGERWKKGS